MSNLINRENYMNKVIFLIISLFFASAHAQNYGEAGCGLGSVVMGKDGNQVLASTTNSTYYINTFAISSGTSNCTDGGAVADNKQVPMFIEVNRLVLAKEASRGQGDTVTGLAHLMGCQPEALGTTLKNNYNKIFVETDMKSSGIENQIQNVISKNRAQTCGA
jgi:hypothetical protein